MVLKLAPPSNRLGGVVGWLFVSHEEAETDMSAAMVEIICAACKTESLLKREPKYEGFKKVGETLSCAACGCVYATEADVPFKPQAKPKVFDDADAPHTVRVFREDEKGQACRYCAHYVVNPFTQRCSLHQKTVEATDWCGQFERKDDTAESAQQ